MKGEDISLPLYWAHRTRDLLEDSGFDDFVARPYNIHNPAPNLWMLLRSVAIPSFPFAKLLVEKETPPGTSESRYHTGLWVEKGWTGKALGLNTSPAAWRVGPHWAWNGFLLDMAGGRLDRVLEQLQDASLDVTITVDVHPLDRDLEQPTDTPPDASLVFLYEEGRLAAEDSCRPELDADYAFEPERIQSFADLAAALQDPVLDFYWVNVRLRAAFSLGERQRIPEAALAFVLAYPEVFGLGPSIK